MNNQLAQLQNWLGENNMDVAYISNPTNILYFTGFESDPAERVLALFVFADQDPFLFTPQLEVESAKKKLAGNSTFTAISITKIHTQSSQIKSRNGMRTLHVGHLKKTTFLFNVTKPF